MLSRTKKGLHQPVPIDTGKMAEHIVNRLATGGRQLLVPGPQ